MESKNTNDSIIPNLPETISVVTRHTGDDTSSRRLLKQILKKISDKTEFLVEEKLFDLLKPYAEDQKTLVCLDNVFSALGIHKIDDINSLKDYFLPYAFCFDCSQPKQEEEHKGEGEPIDANREDRLKMVPMSSSIDIEELETTASRIEKVSDCIERDHLIMIDSSNVLEALREFATAHTNATEEST